MKNSVFRKYLKELKEKYLYRIMDEDPYILYWRTQPSDKYYRDYMIDGFEFNNYIIGKDSKSFDVTFNGETETLIIYKTRGDR